MRWTVLFGVLALGLASCAKQSDEQPGNPDPNPGGAETDAGTGDGGAAVEPHVRILAPKAGDKVAGSTQLELDLVLPEEVATVELGVNGEWTALKAADSLVPLNVGALENGALKLAYRVTDAAGNRFSDAVDVTIENPPQRLENYELSSSIYSNGDTFSVDLQYNVGDLELELDGTDLDTNFNPASVEVEEIEAGLYRVTFPISANNRQADGKRALQITARNASGDEFQSSLRVELRKLPLIPFVVLGGAFSDRGAPPVLLVSEGAPRASAVAANPALVTGGTLDLKVSWEDAPDHPASLIVIAAEDNSGYWTVPVAEATGEQTLQLSLPSLKPAASGKTNNVLVTVVDNQGRAIEWQTVPVKQITVGTGGIQISLNWDNPADLDLHVTDPTGKLVDFATIGSGDGLLDLDSNAECKLDGVNTENVFWADGKEKPGPYTINVSMYAACEQTKVHYTVAAQVCGKVQTFQGDFTAADAKDDPNDLGRLVATITMNCSKRATGTVTFESRETVPGPGTSVTLQPTGATVPAPFVPVQVIRTSDKKCLARSMTDRDGKYDLRFDNSGDPKYTVVAEARWGSLKPAANNTDCPDFDALASVMPLDKDTVYNVASAEQDSNAKPSVTGLKLHATRAANSGAFNINNVVAKGYNWVRLHQGVDLPKLKVRWSLGKDTPIHTSYYDGTSTFFVLSTPSDPDEWDNTVLGHEFSHFVIAKLSKNNSPGGPHSGRSTPTLAWGEGVATALGADMLGENAYLDTTLASGVISCGGSCRKLEADSSILSGTADGKMKSNVDEFMIASVLYDMLDDANEPHDKLTPSYFHYLGSIFTYLKGSHKDRGASGIDFVDFLDGWRCQDKSLTDLSLPGSEAELKTLLQASTVNFPYDFATLTCK